MKKRFLLILLLALFLVCGCSLGDSPSAKVEELLKKYNNNDDVVKTELGDYLNTLALDELNRSDYQDVYLRQYSDLAYEIKDERIDGENAIVTVQVTVYDYYTAENTISNYIATNQTEFYDETGVYNSANAFNYRVNELKKVNDKIDYTLDFTLTKVNDEWSMDPLTNEMLEKIHGTYAH